MFVNLIFKLLNNQLFNVYQKVGKIEIDKYKLI